MFFITRNNKIYYVTLTIKILTVKYFMILLFCSAIILGQSKEEIKSAKKQERTTQKILNHLFGFKFMKKNQAWD